MHDSCLSSARGLTWVSMGHTWLRTDPQACSGKVQSYYLQGSVTPASFDIDC